MNVAIIIPSKTASNLIPCVQTIAEREPELAPSSILVIDDGLDLTEEQKFASGLTYLKGEKPFIFARNVNIGINHRTSAVARFHREPPDVIVLNDDALLKTPNGFSALAEIASVHPEYGLIAATCNNVGNPNQFPRRIGLRDEPRMVCFVCVYIPRKTIEIVGLLDERYTGYGVEDDDYCLRVRNAGLKIGIFDGCFIDHGSLTSTFRGGAQAAGNFRPNLALFKEKWGVDNFGRV